MCNKTCIDFGKAHLAEEVIKGKSVIEVGSLDVNGSLRQVAAAFAPSSYIGVDIQMGRGVDQVCKVEDLIRTFGCERFDVVLCTEVLEHVKDWREAIHNLKEVLKPGGVLLITTRSLGKEYHGYPFDFWRYELSDMKAIFSDFDIIALGRDVPEEPGVFLFARKPSSYDENNLSAYKLYSIVAGGRASVIKNNIYWALICVPQRKLFGKRRWINTLKK